MDIGDVDILVNNAGIVTGRKFLDSPDSLIQKTMEVNANAHFWVSYHNCASVTSTYLSFPNESGKPEPGGGAPCPPPFQFLESPI